MNVKTILTTTTKVIKKSTLPHHSTPAPQNPTPTKQLKQKLTQHHRQMRQKEHKVHEIALPLKNRRRHIFLLLLVRVGRGR